MSPDAPLNPPAPSDAEMPGQDLDAEVLALSDGETYRVLDGAAVLFAIRDVEGGGRRIPIGEVGPGETFAGVDVPDATVIAVGLPGTRVVPEESAEGAVPTRERVLAALAEDDRREIRVADAQEAGSRHDARLLDDALLGLAAVVPGRKPDFYDPGQLPSDVAVVDFMARQVGLRPDPMRLRRASADVTVSGRDPLTALASAAGAVIRRVDLPPGWWASEGPPVLVTAEDGSPGAAVWRGSGYHVWQPESGLQPVLDAGSAGQWGRRGVLMEPLLDPSQPANWQKLARLSLHGNAGSARLVVFLTVVIALLAAVVPVVSGQLTASIASQTGSTLAVIAAALVAFALGDALIRVVRMFAMLRIRGRSTAVAATALWDRMVRLPMRWHNERTVASRLTDATAVDGASMGVPDAIIMSLLDSSAVFGALLGVMIVSPPLALALLAFLVVRGVVEVQVVRRAAVVARQAVDAGAVSQGVTLGLISGVNRLRISGASWRAFALWAQAQARTTAVEVRGRQIMVLQQALGALWPTLGLALLLAITAVTGSSVAQLVTAQTALTASNAALAAAIVAIGAVLRARAVLERADAVLQAIPESGAGQELAALDGTIDLRDLVFGYDPEAPPVLNQVSVSIPAGAHVAIVGPSGCGKSTLLRLILGLEQPDSGLVSFDGRDLSALDRSSVRRQIGSVMQSSELMPGSVRENVDLGRGLTATQVWEALEQAAVADDVRAMPMGLNTVVTEGGGTLSGGQRQRILLARALAGSPRVLILDEATSALDNVSQAAVVQSLDRLEATRIVVAHRLSTIELADTVVMLDGGRVVAQGSFDELMAEPGPFRELVIRQRL